MTRIFAALPFLVAIGFAGSGCVLVFGPDRDDIVRDGGLDGGRDGGDGGSDADARHVADACRPSRPEATETTCDDGMDNDCDGRADCDDWECRSFEDECCDTGLLIESCVSSTAAFERLPVEGSTDLAFEADTADCGQRIARFGPPGVVRALVSTDCQPLHFGVQYNLAFSIATPCATSGESCDYAALSFAPVKRFANGAPTNAHFRVVVRADGSAALERGGEVVVDAMGRRASLPARSFRPDATDRIELRLELQPQPTTGALRAELSIRQVGRPEVSLVVEGVELAPAIDLRCENGRTGLYALIEGAGNGVSVHGELARFERNCGNPSAFREQQGIDLATAQSCAGGGVGAPALTSYCFRNCSNPAAQEVQWDLWLDASLNRSSEIHAEQPFGVCWLARQTQRFPSAPLDDWQTRGGATTMWSAPPSRREPTLLPIVSEGAAVAVEKLWFAYAERIAGRSDEAYQIRGGAVLRDRPFAPDAGQPWIVPADVGCSSVRDPLLLANWRNDANGAAYVDGGFLLFTCHPASGLRSIRAITLDRDGVPVPNSVVDVLSPSELGAYARFGVFGAEGMMEHGVVDQSARVWFMASDGTTSTAIAFADGRAAFGTLPRLATYPGNPVLRSTTPVLAGDCADCVVTGFSVARSFVPSNFYQLLFSRYRSNPSDGSIVHELVPLLQPRPPD